MSRYGWSTDVGADLQKEEEFEEQRKKELEESTQPPKDPPKDDDEQKKDSTPKRPRNYAKLVLVIMVIAVIAFGVFMYSSSLKNRVQTLDDITAAANVEVSKRLLPTDLLNKTADAYTSFSSADENLSESAPEEDLTLNESSKPKENITVNETEVNLTENMTQPINETQDLPVENVTQPVDNQTIEDPSEPDPFDAELMRLFAEKMAESQE